MWHENVELSDCRDKTLKWCQLAMLTSFSDKKKKKKINKPLPGSRYENARPNHGAPLRHGLCC